MIPALDFFSVPRIVFGRGKLATALPELAGPLGPTILVVHNGGHGPLDRVTAALKGKGVRVVPLRQKGEPTVDEVDAGLHLARVAGCTGAIGVGGGSAIDTAKAIAGLMANGGTVLDYLEVIGRGQKLTKPAVPWLAVPTTAGTGAEVTRNAVVGSPERKFKASLRSEGLLARAVIVDADLGTDVPANVTAWSGSDALCQCVEAYTSAGGNPMTDGLALKGVELAGRSLRRAVADGADADARDQMAMAALLSGVALTNAGLGAVHGFAAPLGANFDVPHGAICAALLPVVIETNIMAAAAAGLTAVVNRYADVGRALADNPGLEPDQALSSAIRGTQELAKAIGIPPLKKFGLSPARVPEMVALAKKASSMRFNPVPLSDEKLAEVLTRAIG
ncbi:MAG: alcohol dehydrogenase [Phycisphaerales bacterium]|nr:alcohol dehydrogenase [Phycisphaerales bacterium]